MANPVWPVSLPQSIFVGTVDSREPAAAEFSVDVGPPKSRRTHGNPARNVDAPIVLTGAQREVFDTFFITTLLEGSLEFDWVDPVTDTSTTFRFRSPPSFTFGSSKASGGRWSATFQLRIMP